MSRPELYVFAISHYCEKARWALDHHGIEFDLRHLAPGSHMEVAQKLGAEGSSLPILVAGDEVVQGSSAIIDWADAATDDPSKRLCPEPEFQEECRALEQRLDDRAGVHVRRFYYSEALVEYPETVLPIFARDLQDAERKSIEENWGIVRQLMMARMDLGPEQREESGAIVADELDFLDARLADGRRFLIGDRFSRADVTAASLLAPLAIPPEHPTYGLLEVPPLAAALLDQWKDRPVITWVREMYRDYR